MLTSWRERLSRPRSPSGYRPGYTLDHVRRNLQATEWLVVQPTLAEFRCSGSGQVLQVQERVESHLLMHVVLTEFHLQVSAAFQGTMRLEMRHTGAMCRTGLACLFRSGDKSLFSQAEAGLVKDSALLDALMPLDFKHLIIECREGHWRVVIEHMGGSEVVNRMPAFRRYIQISQEQKGYLWKAFARLEDKLINLQ